MANARPRKRPGGEGGDVAVDYDPRDLVLRSSSWIGPSLVVAVLVLAIGGAAAGYAGMIPGEAGPRLQGLWGAGVGVSQGLWVGLAFGLTADWFRKRRSAGRRILLAGILLLYGSTWLGGWASHALERREEAEARYQGTKDHNRRELVSAQQMGRPPHLFVLHEGGPRSGVSWCVPVVPFILLVDSYASAGPEDGHGGVKVLLYYGLGSTELCTLWDWRA
jgi:hypothetical protein